MSQSLIQRSFAGGEIAPALAGRADQIKYQTGLKTCRNFEVLKHGGIANRTGSQFIVEVKDSSAATYMIKFVFNDSQTYIIEVGNLYMRFIINGAQIVVSGVAAYDAGTTYSIADLVSYGGVNYYSKVDSNLGNQPDVSPTQWYPLTGDIYEIPTPYVTADVPDLQFVQSGDVVTITHTNYKPQELTRTGHTAWYLQDKSFAPTLSAPGGLTATAGAAGSIVYRYKVTSVAADTYEESLPSSAAATAGAVTPTEAAPNTLAWTADPAAQEYNVYRETSDGSGFYAFIGVAGSNSFADSNFTADASISPPTARTPFTSSGNYPRTTSYYQQRNVLASTDNDTEKLWTSRSGMFNNFTISSPLQDDDAVTFVVAGRKVNEIRHVIDLGVLVILTASGEWIVEGDVDGVLRANQPPNLRQVGYNGSALLVPAIIDDSLVYVQARGSIVRDLKYSVSAAGQTATYKGKDLTVFAGHLFINHTLSRMDYAQNPNSIVYIVREDGTLLGLTYLPDHDIWGWHRHDTDGTYEDVCIVPEGIIDAVYVMVNRTINGVTKRYIERFAPRYFTDISVDALFMDSYLTYDGRNTSATTITLSTGAGWTIDDTITLTATSGVFSAGDVGDWYVVNIVDASGNVTDTVTLNIATYTDSTHISGTPSKTVPAALQGVPTASWSHAVQNFSGLDHLEGKDISALADGNVAANPNNDAYTVKTVSSGAVALDRPASVVHIGLPYLSDMQTLDLDIQGQQIRDREKLVTNIALLVQSSRGIWAGSDDQTLHELQPDPITDYGQAWPLKTGQVQMSIDSTWDESGSIFVRQVDPLPLTILSAIPNGGIGG